MPADTPSRDPSLDGNAPDSSPLALVLIDTISDMEFPGGESLFRFALPAARCIAGLKRRAKACGVPVVYANDNFGRWRSDFHEVVEHCSRKGARGRPIVELLAPEEDDYFVLKPKHSAFYATTFDLLLNYLGSRRLIMTGFSGDICVLLSASDAYMRDFRINVPSDCVASVAARYSERGLAYMRRVLDVDTTASDALDLPLLLAQMRE